MIEIELDNSLEQVPEGVKLSLEHFMNIPNSTEGLANYMDQYAIIKATKVNGTFKIEEYNDYKAVDQRYFETEALQQQKLCYLTIVLKESIIVKKELGC